MKTVFRQFSRILIRLPHNQGGKANFGKLFLPKYQPFITSHSKFHIWSYRATYVSHILNQHYAIEEEDGFQMVRVKAPPGAAETATPGHLEWEKTVGARVSAGEVVCRIRFKEDRTLDITSPVAGILAVRRKQEGETVEHGDELFKVRLEVTSDLKQKKSKKKKKTAPKSYFEEEEEFVGKSAIESPVADGKPDLKSAFLSKRDSKKTFQPGDSDLQPPEPGGRHSTMNHHQTVLTQTNMIPYPLAVPSITPISRLMTTINEINMKDTLNFVNEFAKIYEVTYGSKPTLRSIYFKAAAHALKLNPALNIKLINDEAIDRKNIEITVGIRHLKVLVFHTMKDIDKMSYTDISRVIHEIERQVSTGTYKSEKGERGFTVTSEWETGSIVGTPSYSKIATLGLHSTINRPIIKANKIAAYPMMYVSLTYDRKLIADQDAVEFLKIFKQAIEDPRHILVHGN